MTDPHNRESYQTVEDGRCPSSGAVLPPFGLSPQAVSGLRPAATNAVERLAINLRSYAWSRGAERQDDDEEAALAAARSILAAIARRLA